MIKRKLGNTQRELPPIGLGCMGLSEFYGPPTEQATAIRLLHEAIDLGVEHFDTAEVYGLHDRGVIEAGKKADINVIALEDLKLHMPYVANDLPTGAPRLLQSADGYVATLVAGQITARHGKDTGARPGRLVRRSASL